MLLKFFSGLYFFFYFTFYFAKAATPEKLKYIQVIREAVYLLRDIN